jgi:hypothetical protein
MRNVKVSAHDVKQFARAAEIARYGQHHRVRVGALLAKGRHTRGKAWNVVDLNVQQYFAGHAERLVIKDQPAIKGTLYVARLDLNDEPVASWPCSECLVHIKACACVTKIVYHDGTELKKVRIN